MQSLTPETSVLVSPIAASLTKRFTWIFAIAALFSLNSCCHPPFCPSPECSDVPSANQPACPCVDCTTVCCYVESQNESVKDGGCFEYTGPEKLAAAFLKQCSDAKSPKGYAGGVASELSCRVGPVTGVACAVGVTGNAVNVSTDTRCCN